jgi:aminoglycoside 2''-phosphotransferase
MDADAVRRELSRLFPELGTVESLKIAGEGFSSYAVNVDDRWIFRIARNAETMASHVREVAMLPVLRDRLPLPIPDPCFHSGPSGVSPFGVMGYEMLPGTLWTLDFTEQVNLATVAKELADFLSALHAFPLEQAPAIGVGSEDAGALIAEVLPVLPEYLDDLSLRRFRTWWSGYTSHAERYTYTPRLLHNDLWCENILLADDGSEAVGVLDFDQMRIGDPVAEFAALRYVGDDFLNMVREHYAPAYNLEPYFDQRLAAAVILRELGGLRYALRYPDADELDDAVEKVDRAIDRWMT